MSLDYPEYEELRKKINILGLFWRIGDIGYYLSLICMITSPLATIHIMGIQFINRKSNFSWNGALVGGILCTVFWGCLFLISAQLKGFSLKQGKRLI